MRGRKRRLCVAICALFALGVVLTVLLVDGYRLALYVNSFLERWRPQGEYSEIFWDTSKLPWTADMRASAKDIYQELLDYEQRREVAKYRFLSKEQSDLDSSDKAAWRTVFLMIYYRETKFAHTHFPKTMAALYRMPGVSSAFFSIVDPWATLRGHYGIFEGVMRYHLGLSVPDNHTQCFIVVENVRRSWEAGKDMIFDDNYFHHVENNTPQRRVVLFVDFLKDYKSVPLNLLNRFLVWIASFNYKTHETIRLSDRFHDAHEK